MTTAESTDIQPTQLPDGVRFTPTGRKHSIVGGLFLLGFAAFWNGITWTGFLSIASDLWKQGGWSLLGLAGITSFFVPFVVIGAVVAVMAPLVMFGGHHIDVRSGELVSVWTLGPARWRMRRRLDGLRRLAVEPSPSAKHRRKRGSDAPEGPLALTAEFEGQKPLRVGFGASREFLLAVAEAVRTEAARVSPDRLFEADAPVVEIVEGTSDADDGADAEPVVAQPSNSTIVVEPQVDGVTLRVPPGTLRQATKGLFRFSVVWLGMVALFTALGVWGAVTGKVEGDGSPVVAVLVLGVFWAVGVGMLVGALNLTKTRVVIDVIDRQALLVTRQNLFRLRQFEWTVDQLQAVRFGPSGMEVNDKPLMQLQVVPRDGHGAKLGLLTGRDEDELRWLAGLLRSRLGVGG